MADWWMVLYMAAFITILSALHSISRMNMQNFKVTLRFIMTIMATTAPMNQPWMELATLIYLLAAKESRASNPPKGEAFRSHHRTNFLMIMVQLFVVIRHSLPIGEDRRGHCTGLYRR